MVQYPGKRDCLERLSVRLSSVNAPEAGRSDQQDRAERVRAQPGTEIIPCTELKVDCRLGTQGIHGSHQEAWQACRQRLARLGL